MSPTAGVHMLQTQFLAARAHDGAFARGDQGHGNAGIFQQAQALAVMHVEGLRFAAVGVINQPAVGQGAVDVETGQADALGAGDEVIGRGDLAAIRPPVPAAGRGCSARRPGGCSLIDHQQAVDLVALPAGARLPRPGVRPAWFSGLSPSARTPACCMQVDWAFVERAAQVAVGEHAKQLPVVHPPWRSCPGVSGSSPAGPR